MSRHSFEVPTDLPDGPCNPLAGVAFFDAGQPVDVGTLLLDDFIVVARQINRLILNPAIR
ncbi:MAG: hypothetical protein U9R25_13100 [Chloroflexota bacterium]|nr:hypothetical protein [Chloroflexota bacterium]